MTTYTLNTTGNPANDGTAFATQYAACANGDTIQLGLGFVGYLGTNFNWNKGVLIKAVAIGSAWTHPILGSKPEFVRKTATLHFLGQWNVTNPNTLRFEDVLLRPPLNIWPTFGATGQTWYAKLSALNGGPGGPGDMFAGIYGGTGKLEIVRCEAAGGYGNNLDPFVPGFRYPGTYGPTTYYSRPGNVGDSEGRLSLVQDGTFTVPFSVPGHGDNPASLPNKFGNFIYNDIVGSPGFINSNHENVYVEDTYIHDFKSAVSCTTNRKNKDCRYEIQRCITENIYLFDFILNSLGDYPDNNPPIVSRAISFGTFAHVNDLCNPHRDFYYPDMNGSDRRVAFRLYKCISLPNKLDVGFPTSVRDQPNPTYLSTLMSLGHQYYWNMFIQSAGLQIDCLQTCPDVVGNIVTSAGYFTPTYRGQESGLAHMHVNKAFPQVVDSRGRIESNIIGDFQTDMSNVTLNNISTGNPVNNPGSYSTKIAATLVDPLNTNLNTLDEIYAAHLPKAGVITTGSGNPYPSVNALRANNDVSAIPPHAVPLDFKNATAGSGLKVTSDLAFKHGGNWGDGHTITPGTGLEWREVDFDGLTQLQAWSSGPGTVHTGKFIQLRAVPPAVAGTNRGLNYTIGSRSFIWNVVAKSNNKLPAAQLNSLRLVNTAGLKDENNSVVADADGFSGFIICKYNVDPGDNWWLTQSSPGEGPGGNWRWYVRQFGSGQFPMAVNSSGNTTGSCGAQFSLGGPTIGVADGVIMYAWSYDFRAADGANGRHLYINYGGAWHDISNVFFSQGWDVSTPHGFDQIINLFSGSNNDGPCAADIYAYGLYHRPIGWGDNSNFLLNKLDPNNPDMLGPRGQAFTLNKEPMLLFGVGDAAKINAGNFNLNTRNPFAVGTGTATDKAIANACAPGTHLAMSAQVLTAKPCVGAPVDVLVTFSNPNAATVVTPTWGGVTRSAADGAKTAPEMSNGIIFSVTPTASGNLILDLSNNQNHTNPAQVVIPIATAPVVIPVVIRIPGMSDTNAPRLHTTVTIDGTVSVGGGQQAD